MPKNYWVLMFARMASYAVGSALVLAALAVMPSFESRLRRAGERTLGPYTLSFAVVLIVRSLTPLTDDQAWNHILPLQVILWCSTFVLFTPQVSQPEPRAMAKIGPITGCMQGFSARPAWCREAKAPPWWRCLGLGCHPDPSRPPGTQAHAISRNLIMPPLGRLGLFPDTWEGDPEGTSGADHDQQGPYAPWTPRSAGSTPRASGLDEYG